MNLSRRLFGADVPRPPASSPTLGRPAPPPLPPQERTFSDGGQRHGGGPSSAGGAGRSPYEDNVFGTRRRGAAGGGGRRWSYMLQDVPAAVRDALNDVNRGYVARVAAVVGLTAGVCALVYYGVLVPAQERRPLAQRSSLFSPKVPITLVEKTREEGSAMYVYRFALPNSYDYAGYEPVSSVRLHSGRVRELSSLARWYTPISHPDERGFIEFAVKDCDPGRMCSRLRYLELGDVVYLGRWMREFDYGAVRREGGELGVICTTAGASVALQLLKCMEMEKEKEKGKGAAPTRLQLLYCHASPRQIPFKRNYFDRYEARMPDRVSVKYNVLSVGSRGADPSLVTGENCFVGHIDPETIAKAMPPPIRTTTAAAADGDGGAVVAVRPRILVCGPQSMMTYLCGRVSPISNYTYWQGWPFRYTGFMKDMGYERGQVYKFGVSTHFLAIH